VIDFRSLRFGVEVECTGQTREKVAHAIQSVVGGEVAYIGAQGSLDPWEVTDRSHRKWRVVSDASLTDAPANLRAEVVTPILSYEDIPELQEVIRAVRRAGARATDCCGCHVHVSGDLFTGRTLGNLLKIFYRQQEIIIQAFGVRSDRLTKYTKRIDSALIKKIEKEHPETIADMNTIWFGSYTPNPQHYHPSRYSILNLASLYQHGSVEFRGANSSLHAGMIRAYIVFSLAIVAKALNSKRACGKPRKYDPRSAKFDFRVFAAIGLGLMGDEFKTVRRNLLQNLPGDSAWKYGRPKLCGVGKKGVK
jgi:hypothetical protein